jgi:hypothetical protein
MTTINLSTQDDNTTTFYIDVYGDIFETSKEASLLGISKEVIVDNFYPGTIDEWKRYILSQLN